MIKYECDHKLNEMNREIGKAQGLKTQVEEEETRLRRFIQDIEGVVRERDNEIANLRATIDQLECNMRNLSGDFLFSCRQMSKEEYVKLLSTLEDEKKDLLKYMQELHERLKKESMKVSEQQDVIGKLRYKITKLDLKLKELEAEKETIKLSHRRVMRISEYARGSLVRPVTRSSDKLTAEVDKLKFR